MATRTLTREQGHTHARDNARRAERRRAHTRWLWLAMGAFVVAAGAIAVFSSGGSSVKTAPGIEQARPVQVNGAALPELRTGTDAAIGLAIPEVSGASFNGTPVSITHDGRPKLILFVAHWCPHCQKEVPLIVSHLNQKALAAGVDLIAVSTSASADKPNYPPSEWLAIEDWKWPVIADSNDGATALAYGLPGFPYFVAADASGKVVGRTSGEISMNDFDALVQKALAPGAG
jgi:thiol-disulfide isomerase/thioredoxin